MRRVRRVKRRRGVRRRSERRESAGQRRIGGRGGAQRSQRGERERAENGIERVRRVGRHGRRERGASPGALHEQRVGQGSGIQRRRGVLLLGNLRKRGHQRGKHTERGSHGVLGGGNLRRAYVVHASERIPVHRQRRQRRLRGSRVRRDKPRDGGSARGVGETRPRRERGGDDAHQRRVHRPPVRSATVSPRAVLHEHLLEDVLQDRGHRRRGAGAGPEQLRRESEQREGHRVLPGGALGGKDRSFEHRQADGGSPGWSHRGQRAPHRVRNAKKGRRRQLSQRVIRRGGRERRGGVESERGPLEPRVVVSASLCAR